MVADKASNGSANSATAMDYPAHERNYAGFLKMFKWGSIAAAIAAAVVIFVISH